MQRKDSSEDTNGAVVNFSRSRENFWRALGSCVRAVSLRPVRPSVPSVTKMTINRILRPIGPITIGPLRDPFIKNTGYIEH